MSSENDNREAQERLEALLLEGIRSGPPSEMTPEDWRQIRMEALETLESRSRKSG